jgi:TonB family protein
MSFFQPDPEELEARRLEQLRRQREAQRFVFVEPRVDMEAFRPPPRAELSDKDRRAQARERALTPENPLPFSRGDSPERTESAEDERKPGPEAEAPPPAPQPTPPEPEERVARALPPADFGVRTSPSPSRPAPGALGDALRNLQRYVENQTFRNPQGGVNDPGSTIQFDTKGVEFGPWIRRFVAQIKRNWFIPHAALAFRGHVVLQFNIHKNGTITDLVVAAPSDIEAFNRAAFNAILGSNPTEPLPPEYPEAKAFFTVTFYYNEQPPLF